MKFKVVIIESVEVDGKRVICYFQEDPNKQHFQINCSFNAFDHGIRKWEVWQFRLRFRSEIFEDPKTKEKTYWTHFDSDSAEPVNVMGRK